MKMVNLKSRNKNYFISKDERLGVFLITHNKKGAEKELLKRGYRKGASEGCYLMPEDIVLDEDQRA